MQLLLCADLRPEPAIIATRYASFPCTRSVISNNSLYHALGNNFRYFYEPVTCWVF
jgi:hypothetical protein